MENEKNNVVAPLNDDDAATKEVLDTYIKARDVSGRGYAYFGGRSLFESIDDWTKRWNGYVPPMNPLLDQTQSNIFINFTRNAIISYLAKVAMAPVKPKIISVNKKTGLPNQKFADLLTDLNKYSLQAENAEAKFLMAGLECCTKGTVIVYEGYSKQVQKIKSPIQFDAETGKVKWKEEDRVTFDNCYQEVIPLEDFFILNPYQPDVQKQPKVIWRKLTSFSEGEAEFGHYKNWKKVQPGIYSVASTLQTFYAQSQLTDLQGDQVEILRYYSKTDNRHIVVINSIVIYDGPIPFKDGKYPFAKTINEPFAVNFFWGNGHPNKYMGEQDLINTFINAMADKTINSLVPTGLSSDLDDLIEDDVVEMGKFRKVGDIEKWKYFDAPQVGQGEINMFNQIMSLARESASSDAGAATTPRGGKMQTRQILLRQQEVMSKVSFNMSFLEDLERDRTELRLSHILQFYSIPKMEKVTGVKGKEIQKLTYREVQLTDTKLSDGRTGNKIIQLIGDEHQNPDARAKIADNLSVRETMGELNGTPTEALALSVDMFRDFENRIQVIPNSSYEKNQAIDQAARMEFANWRLGVAPLVPIKNPQGLVDYVEEAFDIETDQFEEAPGTNGAPQAPGAPTAPPVNPVQAGGPGKPQILNQNKPSAVAGQALANM